MNHVTKFRADKRALQSGKWRRNAPYAAFTLISVILFVAIRKTGLGAIYIITGPGWALVLIVDIITLTATLAWNYYIGRFH